MRPLRPIIILLVSLSITANAAGSPEMQKLLDRFKELEDFCNLIEREYHQPADRQRLWDGALRGMLSGLDPYSTYLTREEVLLRNRDPQGLNVGFGFDWHADQANGRIAVARVVDGGPADLAGLAVGDTVVAVDGQAIADLTLVAVRERMLSLGAQAALTVRHADGSEETATLARAPYGDQGVTGARLLDKRLGIGYVRISRFIETPAPADPAAKRATTITARAFRAAVDRLAEEGLRALIIDLRGNGGGGLLAAVEVADAFLNARDGDGTLIVAQSGRSPAHQATWLAHSDDTYPNWPLAVLVDEHTASSAEVLAACWQDHRRAVVIGRPTAGKDSVQQQFLLPSGAAVLLTVARFRTASGRDLAANGGVPPDIAATLTPVQALALARARLAARAGTPVEAPADPPVAAARDALTAALIHGNFIGLR